MSDLFLDLKVHLLALSQFKGQSEQDQLPATPVLDRVLDQLRIGYAHRMTRDELKTSFIETIAALGRRFDYFEQSEMKVNELLNDYLKSDIMQFLWAEKPVLPDPRTVAMAVCALGNKGGEHIHGSGVDEIWAFAKEQLEHFEGDAFNPDRIHFLSEERIVNQLQFAEQVLHIVDVFVASRLGMLAGVEEFAPGYYVDPDSFPEPDFEPEGCVGPSNDCDCGCEFDHGLTILEGLEDFLNGQNTPACAYMQAVAFSNGIRLQDITGNEGAIIDGIKDMGSKAWEALKAAFDAIMSMFDPKEEEAKAAAAAETTEDNKKALQAMEDKSLVINDAAKNGIIKLADSAYPQGEMKAIVTKLSTVASAPRVIDALMGLMKKETRGGDKLVKARDKAKAALDELKSSTNKAGTADEKNKEAVAAAKAAVGEKTKAAREALSAAKKEVGGHKKRMAAIKKAINGINPKIFSKAGEAKEAPATPAANKPAKPKKTPEAKPA